MDCDCLKTYVSLCSAYVLPAPWKTLKAPWAFRTPADPAETLRQLLAQYDNRSLLACGIAVENEDRLWMNPLLAQPDAPLIVLTSPEGVSDLLTNGGCLRGERWPLFGALDDEHARTAIQGEEPTMWLTADLDDAIVLRALGWIAAPVVGLEELDQRGVELLGKFYGLHIRPNGRPDNRFEVQRLDEQPQLSSERPADIVAARDCSLDEVSREDGGRRKNTSIGGVTPDDPDRLELVLVKWSPSTLSLAEPEAVHRAAERLRELGEFCGVEVLDVGEWRPTPDDLRRIRFACERGGASWQKDAMQSSQDRSSGVLSEALPAKTPTNPVDALEQLRQALFDDERGMDVRRRRQEALDVCHRVAMNRVIEQLFEEVDAEPDPLRRALMLQFAQLVELQGAKMASIRQSVLLPDRSRQDPRELARDSSVREVLTIGHQILALARETKEWNRRQNSCLARPARPTISLPVFGK